MKKRPKKPTFIEMCDLVLPSYTNVYNTLFGGKLMEIIDKAAAICAMRYCHEPVVTASVEAIDFHTPIKEGAIIQIIAKIIHVGQTSMMVKVNVKGEDPLTGKQEDCCTAFATLVAINKECKPTIVPALLVETEEEKQAWEEGLQIRKNTMSRREAANQVKHLA
jgi:acyl-CoA hydrolase